MRAMVLEQFGGDFELQERPVPIPGHGQVLVRVVAVGAGVTNELAREGTLGGSVPRVHGHELAGTIAKPGPGVQGWSLGDRVTTSFYLLCNRCQWCASGRETLCENFGGFIGIAVDGAFADYTLLPSTNLVRIPDELDLGDAGVVGDKRWVATEEAKVVRGDWIDPAAGKITFSASTGLGAAPGLAGVDARERGPCHRERDVRRHAVAIDTPLARRGMGQEHDLAARADDDRHTVHDRARVFRAAVADRLLASDPTVGVVLPRKWKAEAAMSIPTNADVAKLLRSAEPERRPKSRPGLTAYVALCAVAGLRRGEALGVQVGDIDFLGRTLLVTRQLQRAKAADVAAGKNLVEAAGGITVVLGPPMYESERTTYLPDEVITILSEHVRMHTPGGELSRWLFDEDRPAVARQPRRLSLAINPAQTPGWPANSTSCGTTSPAD